MIKQLLNSVISKYRDLSVASRSVICLSFRPRQIIDLLATDKSRYFGVYLGVRTCELFLCFAPFVFLGSIVFTSLFSLFYVTREFNRFLHRS